MSGRTIDDFLDNADEFNSLSDEDKALLISGGVLEGETEAKPEEGSAEESGEAPEAAKVEANEDQPPANNQEQQPVVLAKDGQHTIPFSELEAARERARQLEQELAAIKAAKPEDQQPAKADDGKQGASAQPNVTEQLSALVEERDNALYAGDTEKAKELGLKIIGIQNDIATQAAIAALEAKESERKAQTEQQTAYDQGIQRANDLVAKYPFLNPQSPNVNQDAIDLVVAQRDKLMAKGLTFADAIDKAVSKVAPLFDKSVTTSQTEAEVAKKASEAITKAKQQVPTSLSQVPVGSAAHHDEGESVRSKSGLSLLNVFEGKSSEDILKQLSRVI